MILIYYQAKDTGRERLILESCELTWGFSASASELRPSSLWTVDTESKGATQPGTSHSDSPPLLLPGAKLPHRDAVRKTAVRPVNERGVLKNQQA